jgi:hypothetical protein
MIGDSSSASDCNACATEPMTVSATADVISPAWRDTLVKPFDEYGLSMISTTPGSPRAS